MVDFFSGSKPDLISMKSMNDLVNIVFEGGGGTVENFQNAITTLTKPSTFDIKNIYTEYIKPNILAIIIIFIFVICILFRYFSLKDENFNPSEPIDSQINRNNYISGIDVNIPVLYDLEVINKLTDDEILNKMKKKSKQFERSPNNNNNNNYSEEFPKDNREEIIYHSKTFDSDCDGFD